VLHSTNARVAGAFVFAVVTQACWALEVQFRPVADGVYAYIGDKGPRSIDNEGLNANVGLVVTPVGAVLIDSGATFQSAGKIAAAAKKVTAQPVRWVINTGGQDHRWLGNGYFHAKGTELIGHAAARADMQSRGANSSSRCARYWTRRLASRRVDKEPGATSGDMVKV
jgi:glyoxylase-like metal-dependent hydrolase (beta-lactamase superfamily II)